MDLLNTLDMVVVEILEDDSFRTVGRAPEWFKTVYPNAALDEGNFLPNMLSPFLDNFLVDAKDFWASKTMGQLTSGPWMESDVEGNGYELEATAVRTPHNKMLLIELCGFSHHERRNIIQKGREIHLDYERLQKLKKALLKAHENLEQRVTERTAALAEANVLLQQEIRERQRSEEALRQSEQFLQNIFDAIQDGILVLDKDLNIIRVNRALQERFGGPAAKIHKKCYAAYQNRTSPCPWCSAQETLDTGEARSRIVPYPSAEEPIDWIELSTFPFKNAQGETSGVIEYFRDVTASKRAEKRELEMQGQLLRAQKMEAIGTLTGGIAHDFNNILSAIIGYSELAMADLPVGSKLRNELDSILNAGYRARELVRQILSISYHSEETRRTTDVVHLVKEAVQFLRAVLPSTIEIRQQISADILPVWADPTQLHQIVMNLCTNAAHAMAEKGGGLEIGLENVHFESAFTDEHVTLEAGAYVQLTVRDSGAGIPPETLQRIFDPYFTTKEKGKGTGLGLAVVQGVVRSHGGAVRVESEPGRGSRFSIFLPAAQEAPALRPEQSATMAAGNERILFIDDEETIANFGKRALERLGYRVVAITASRQALKLFRDDPGRFDLVISDLTMPGMTGDKLIREFLSIRSDIPIILCTGFSEQVREVQAKALGARAFLMKPLTIKTLGDTVRRVLDENR